MKPCFGCAQAEDATNGYKCRLGCALWDAWVLTVSHVRLARRVNSAATVTAAPVKEKK